MKRLLTFVLLSIICMGLAIWGQAQNNLAIAYVGIILGGFLALSLVVYLIKFLFGLVGINVSSFLFMLAIAIIAGVLTWHGYTSPMIAYGTGILIGLLLTIFTLRKIGKVAQASTIFGELFGFITGYQVKVFITKDSVVTKEDKESDIAEHRDLILILNQYFPKTVSKNLADYVIDNMPQASLPEKVKAAFQYRGSEN